MDSWSYQVSRPGDTVDGRMGRKMGYARSNMTVSKICIGSMRASLEGDVRLCASLAK